jgi:hypothetical protein
LNTQNFAAYTGNVVLKDRFKNQLFTIDKTGLVTTVPFNITNDTASKANNRFVVLFGTVTPLPVSITALKAYQKGTGIQVEWNVTNEENMAGYAIEKSVDGVSFTQVGAVTANHSSNYNWMDVSPLKGNNFYRIKTQDKNGSISYTETVNVKIGSTKNLFTIVGNPVHNKLLVLQLENVDKGNYTLQVFNNIGQQVATQTWLHNGGSATQTMSLGNVAAGTYQVRITNGNVVKLAKTVVVE